MESVLFIPENKVRDFLDWSSLEAAIEKAISSVTSGDAVQNPRSFLKIGNNEAMLGTMPGYLKSSENKNGALVCKIVNVFPHNSTREKPLPNIVANIMLFDDTTGEMKCVMGGITITAWRTATASVVASKHLHSNPEHKNKILAILGAGTQGRIHAIAFQKLIKYDEVHIWNHNPEKAEKLVQELEAMNLPGIIRAYVSAEACVYDADVIVTATTSKNPILKKVWVKPGAHINAIGAGTTHHNELDLELYKSSWICVDYWGGAKTELVDLIERGIDIKAELGEVILKRRSLPSSSTITIFHSLGMAVEDAAAASLVYNKYIDLKIKEPHVCISNK